MPLPFPFNWKQPDYIQVFEWRLERLARIRSNPSCLPMLKAFYAEHPAQFIMDWGCTVDPRNVDRKLPAVVPFLLFPKQEEWVSWFLDTWRARENGLVEKSRDVGMSWLAVAAAATMCMFRSGFSAGFGSRKEEYVDRIGDPKSLFWKAREFVELVPVEFRAGWTRKDCAPHMRMLFPETGAVMTGEAGDSIGRGDRTSVYFVDEAAHVDRPQLIEASLSATTNCRIDVSSANGTNNPFYEKLTSGRSRTFRLHWRDDPRKDEAWYEVQKAKLDPVTLAQEVDIDYNASTKGALIPSAWVQAAVDAHSRLGIKISGPRSAALDVADQGTDFNAWCAARGILIESVEEWSGKGGDIAATVAWAFALCDGMNIREMLYDGDGLGAGVRGDARVLNVERRKEKREAIDVDAFRSSEAPVDPDSKVPGTDRTNGDMFANRKAQAWWGLRERFRLTYLWVVEGKFCDPDSIISIAPDCPNRNKLLGELVQPTYGLNNAGKISINKTPDGTRSPNLADSVMMRFSKRKRGPVKITAAAMQAAMTKTRRR